MDTTVKGIITSILLEGHLYLRDGVWVCMSTPHSLVENWIHYGPLDKIQLILSLVGVILGGLPLTDITINDNIQLITFIIWLIVIVVAIKNNVSKMKELENLNAKAKQDHDKISELIKK